MATVTVTLSTTEIVPAAPIHRTVNLMNITGTQPVSLEIGAPAVVATSYRWAAADKLSIDLGPGVALNGITVTASQDVRYLLT